MAKKSIKKPAKKTAPVFPEGTLEPIKEFVLKCRRNSQRGMKVPDWGTVAQEAVLNVSFVSDSAMSWLEYGNSGKKICQVEKFIFVVSGKEIAYTRYEIYNSLKTDRGEGTPKLYEDFCRVENPETFSAVEHTGVMCKVFDFIRRKAVASIEKKETTYASANISKLDNLHLATSKLAEVTVQKGIFDAFDHNKGRGSYELEAGCNVNVARRGETENNTKVNYLYAIGEEYDAFDAVIQDHISSLMIENEAATGDKYFRISLNRLCASIYGEYDNPDYSPTGKQADDVRRRLEVMRHSDVRIAWNKTVKRKGVDVVKEMKIGGNIIEYEWIKISAGGKTLEGYEFHSIPAAFRYSVDMRQISTVRRSLLKYTNKNCYGDKKFVILEHALIKIVARMRTDSAERLIPKRTLKTILEACGRDIEEMTRRSMELLRDDIKTILDGMVAGGELKKWEWYYGGYNDKEIVGVEMTLSDTGITAFSKPSLGNLITFRIPEK